MMWFIFSITMVVAYLVYMVIRIQQAVRDINSVLRQVALEIRASKRGSTNGDI